MMTNSPQIPADVRRRLPGRVPADRIRTTEVPRHPVELADRLLALPDISSAVADALDELGRGSALARSRLTPLGPGQCTVGPAVTLRYVPTDGDATSNRGRDAGLIFGDRDLYGIGCPGDVAVVDASAVLPNAIIGGLSATWAHKAGFSACITDGAVRDSESILQTGLPVWSADRVPRAGRYRIETAEINGPISLAYAVVRPGDYIVADSDGICIIPHDHFPKVVQMCVEAQGAERNLLNAIASATSIEHLVELTDARSPV